MKRLFLTVAFTIALLAGSGVAWAKGEVVAIGISGGGLQSEVRLPAGGDDVLYDWLYIPPAARPRGVSYRVVFYMRLSPEHELFPTNPMTYYPASTGRPAMLLISDGRTTMTPVSPRPALERLINSAIAQGLGAGAVSARMAGKLARDDGASSRFPGGVAALILGVAAFVLTRRGTVRSGRRLVHAGRA